MAEGGRGRSKKHDGRDEVAPERVVVPSGLHTTPKLESRSKRGMFIIVSVHCKKCIICIGNIRRVGTSSSEQ